MTEYRDIKIAVVGAGVFGLTTCLHLQRRGYTNIHLFDKQPYHKNHYAYAEGAHAASADENKILRASYGGKKLYQDLAFKAMPEWQRWNEKLASTLPKDLPSGLSPEILLWNNCGYVRLNEYGLDESEKQTQENFPEKIKHTQYRVSDPARREDAKREGIPESKFDPFNRLALGKPVDGILDMTAGFVLAAAACSFALHQCRESGISIHLGPQFALKSLVRAGSKVTGIETVDHQRHKADLVVVACGGWTPSLVPEVEDLLETTSGSVLAFRLPKDRPDLWQKYSPDRFPVFDWCMGSYEPRKNVGGLYALPRTPDGVFKLAFRGAKWTSYTRRSTSTGHCISYPETGGDKVPEESMRVIYEFCKDNLPDLLELDLEYARLCPYTDSVDNSFLIDYVPGSENLVVASGGSGHGFKFLPVLGEHIVDVIERRDTEYTRLFRWRKRPEGRRNGLEEGPDGWRNLDKQKMADKGWWNHRRGSML